MIYNGKPKHKDTDQTRKGPASGVDVWLNSDKTSIQQQFDLAAIDSSLRNVTPSMSIPLPTAR